jgi:hypothetical protein
LFPYDASARQRLFLGFAGNTQTFALPETDDAARSICFEQAKDTLVWKAGLTIPIWVELTLKVGVIRSGFRFLNKSESVSYLGSQDLAYEIRPFDPYVVQQAEFSTLFNVRPR